MSRPSGETVPPESRYSNHFCVGFNAFEVILDFAQHYAEGEDLKSHTRIVTSPAYAQVLAELLEGALHDYEQAYGPIPREQEVRAPKPFKEKK